MKIYSWMQVISGFMKTTQGSCLLFRTNTKSSSPKTAAK